MNVVLPDFIVGPIAIAIGVLVFIFRQTIRDWTVKSESGAVGDRLGQFQTPFWVGFAGLGGIVVGLTMLVGGVVVLVTTG